MIKVFKIFKLRGETVKAWLVEIDPNENLEIDWWPKSQCTLQLEPPEQREFVAPLWLIRKKRQEQQRLREEEQRQATKPVGRTTNDHLVIPEKGKRRFNLDD